MSKNMNVPKLRFKEFGGEWSKNTTNIKIVSGNTYPLDAYSKKGTLLIQGLNIYPNELQLDNPIYISDSYLTGKDVFVNKENILLGLNRPIIGKRLKACLFMKDRAVLYQRAGILDFDKSKLSSRFLFQYLFTPSFVKQLLAELVGSDQPYIKSDLFKVTKNLFPSKQEQEKIASFLTSVDTKIEQLTKKEKLLQQYKKGVMQKIFNQEIRFKADDGSEFEDWEEKDLGSFGKFYRGHSYSSSDVQNNGLLVLRSSNIQDGSLILDKDLQFVSKDCKDNIVLQKDDIVICMANGSKHLVGKTGVYDGSYSGKVTVGAFCSILRAKNDFVNYVLQTVEYRKYLHILLAGTNINNLKNSELEELKFTVPSSKKEQTKIANFLSSIDSKIEQVSAQLDSTKEFKKALLQQMFV